MKAQWKPLPTLFLGVLGLAVFSLGAPRATSQEDQAQESTGWFTVDVETIVVNVLVTDRNGKPLTGLQKENFRIFEDGEEQVVQNFSLWMLPLVSGCCWTPVTARWASWPGFRIPPLSFWIRFIPMTK